MTIVAVCVIVLIILFIVFFWPANNDCGQDQQCFMTQAGNCMQASYQQTIQGGTAITYTTDNCMVNVKVTAVGAGEPAALRTALEGKTMTCDVSNGINETLLTFPPPLDSCTGPLADTLNNIKLALIVA
jgi:hypothetical protein